MLANNNKSVAVSGGHIPSYNSNRWAILTGLPSPCLSVHLSLSPSCLSSVCPTALGFFLHKLVFQLSPPPPLPHIIFVTKFRRIASVLTLETCNGWLHSCLCIFYLLFPFGPNISVQKKKKRGLSGDKTRPLVVN